MNACIRAEISNLIHEEKNKCSKYMVTLQSIRLLNVDILALDKKGTKAIFCECKFRNRPMPMEEYEDLILASKAFPSAEEKYFIFISKSGFTNPVLRRAGEDGAMLFTLEDLFA